MDFTILLEPGSWVIIMTLVLMEGVLSLDNATVLATIVRDLPENKRNKALYYGIVGAFAFRILALLSVNWLLAMNWLKLLGALYLLWIVFDFFFEERKRLVLWFKVLTSLFFLFFVQQEKVLHISNTLQVDKSTYYFSIEIDYVQLLRYVMGLVVIYFLWVMHKGIFFSVLRRIFRFKMSDKAVEEKNKKVRSFIRVIVAVELADLAFSIDNVFVAVGMTQHTLLIIIGVVLGIITMRFAVRLMNSLLKKYPFLDRSAHIVIGLVAVKMVISYVCAVSHGSALCKFLEKGHMLEIIMTVLTVFIFVVPIALAEYRLYMSQKRKLLRNLFNQVVADGKVDEQEVLALKQAIVEDDNRIDGQEMELLLKINKRVRANISQNDTAWYEFFMDAIKIYCMDDFKQPFVISDDEAHLIMKYLKRKKLMNYEVHALQNLVELTEILPRPFMIWAQSVGVDCRRFE